MSIFVLLAFCKIVHICISTYDARENVIYFLPQLSKLKNSEYRHFQQCAHMCPASFAIQFQIATDTSECHYVECYLIFVFHFIV